MWGHVANIILLKDNIEKNFTLISSDNFLYRFLNSIILQGEEWSQEESKVYNNPKIHEEFRGENILLWHLHAAL